MIRKTEKPFWPVLQVFFFVVLVLSLPAVGIVQGRTGASFTDEEAETFIREWVKLSENNKNFDAVMGMYSGEGEFYKHGVVKKSVIAGDKQKYFDRWPQREHRIISVVLHPGELDNEKLAEVLFHYKIRKEQKGLEGDAKTLLSLRKIQSKITIFSEKDIPPSAIPAASVGGTEYLVWSGYGETAWIDAEGTVLRRSKEKVPMAVLNDALYSARIAMRTVKQADCSDTRFIENPDVNPTLKNVSVRQLSLTSILKDGKKRTTVLFPPADNDAGESEADIEILGAIGPWLFVERSVSSYVCGGPHGATAKETLIVNRETLKTVRAYNGQEKDEVEKSILGEQSESASSSLTLFSGEEYRALLNALSGAAKKDIGDSGETGEFRVTRIRPVAEHDKLGLEVLLTTPTGYASSDGKWSSYTISHAYLSPVMPDLLKPYRNIPPAVLKWWKASKKGSCPNWSEVPPSGTVRQQLEKLF